MFISRKKKQFIYTLLYLLPFFIFLIFFISNSFLSNAFSLNFDMTSDDFFPQTILDTFYRYFYYQYRENPLNEWFTALIESFDFDYVLSLLPITSLFDFIFFDVVSNTENIPAFLWFTLYFDYCIWLNVAIICFDVITLIPVICHKFVHRLSGVNE